MKPVVLIFAGIITFVLGFVFVSPWARQPGHAKPITVNGKKQEVRLSAQLQENKQVVSRLEDLPSTRDEKNQNAGDGTKEVSDNEHERINAKLDLMTILGDQLTQKKITAQQNDEILGKLNRIHAYERELENSSDLSLHPNKKGEMVFFVSTILQDKPVSFESSDVIVVHAALDLAADLREVMLIDVLVRYSDFPVTYQRNAETSLEDIYPALRGLGYMGEGGVDSLLWTLYARRREVSNKALHNVAYVLGKIFQNKKEAGKARIDNFISQQTDEVFQKRLKETLLKPFP